MSKEHDNPPVKLTIDALGGIGDGLARYEGNTVFVPLTCPGDTVNAILHKAGKDHLRATATEIITPSEHRQLPPCRHFGTCGGCSLQHLNSTTYTRFKQNILAHIITELGVAPSVITPMVEVGEKSRRRAEFKIAVNKGVVSLGFYAPKSHDIIALTECPVSDDRLTALLPPLKNCLQSLKKPGMLKAISVTALDSGLDAIIIVRSPLSDSDREKLVSFAKAHNVARLNEHIQTHELSHTSPSAEHSTCLYDGENSAIALGGVQVLLPVGAFLQATHKGQTAITQLVTEHLAGCERIADLYAGCGTYSFELVKHTASVTAYEGTEDMVQAMHNAIIRNNLEGRMTAYTRDLFTRPLNKEELNRFDGVVINPPRNGALPQIKHLITSAARTIVMVSCNPATFKRDAQCLIKGGYRLTRATAIDQFYWSGHLELVACFQRQK